MKLDEVAKALGYTDSKHLEKCIEAYGTPLDKWWDVMQKVVNKLPLYGVSDSVCPICKTPFKKGEGYGDYCSYDCWDTDY